MTKEAERSRNRSAAAQQRVPVPIKVLYVIDSLGLGGAQTVLQQIVLGLDRGLFQPIVCALHERPSLVAESIEAGGIESIALGGKPTDPLVIPRLIAQLRQLMHEHSPAIVHTHLAVSKICGRIAALQAGVPVILSHEHATHEIFERFPFNLLDRWLTLLTDGGLACSNYACRYMAQRTNVSLSSYRVIYNAVDIERFAPSGQREATREELSLTTQHQVVSFISRLHRQKNPLLFIEAAKLIAVQQPLVRFFIAGAGPLEKRVQSIVKRYNLESTVCLLGVRGDIPRLLEASDVFILPSWYEQLPLLLLEAMAAHVPVVATSVGGVPEVITHEVNGLLTTPGDAWGLAEATLRLLGDPELARRLAENGWSTVNERFTIRHMVGDIQDVYEQLLRQKGLW